MDCVDRSYWCPETWRRKTFALVFLLLTLLVGCSQKDRSSPSQSRSKKLNVLLITLDTTRADHLSCYTRLSHQGDENAAISSPAQDFATTHFAKTPHLDALASRGVLFAHAIVQVPLTIPSHACILTGTYPFVNHVRSNGGFVLAKIFPTIATITRQAGYATAAVLGSSILNRRYGLAHGFATYDDHIVDHQDNRLPDRYSKRPGSIVTAHAIEWLKQHYKSSFFIWVHYYDAHAPYDPPEPFKRIYGKDPYSGEIAYMDEEVGRLLGWIDQDGLRPRTLVLVIGDHGEGLGEHGERHHGIFLYDSTLHVPFIMAGPGVPVGKVVDAQVRSIDLMPTVLALLHLSPGPYVQGVSLWPLILHNFPVQTSIAYCETLYPRLFMGWSELRAIHTQKWEFILAPHPELYNLQADPQETTNVFARNPVQAQELEADLWGVLGGPHNDNKVSTVPLSPAERADLESLGYLNGGLPSEIHLGTKAPDPKDYVDVLNMVDQAEDLLDEGYYRRAVIVMEKALRRDPTNPAVHLCLATALELTGQYQRAIKVYKHAIKMKLENDEIYSRLGKLYLRLHQLDKAAATMAHAAEMNPTDVDNMCRLGTVYLQLGREDDAARAFEAVIGQSDRFGPAYNGLGLIAITRGDAEGAKQDFLKAIQLDPADLEPALNLGVLYQKAGDRQQALHYLTLFAQKASPQQYGALLPKVRATIREIRRQ